MRSWSHTIDARLLSRFSADFPIVAAICGGGSSGKSTLFNSLLGQRLAPTGGRAGMNRRVLFSVPASRSHQSDFIADLVEPFQSEPHPLKNKEDLLVPGNPLYVVDDTKGSRRVLLDTPDFDTGARGRYTNRDITRMALEAADILIYIFTNANYNNRDNTDFIARMLTGIGRRKCFLVYRVYPSFTDSEVYEHALTVARGIYGDQADEYLLGIYRADESNAVAADRQFMRLRPARPQDQDFEKALAAIDIAGLRIALHASIFKDILDKSGAMLAEARLDLDELRLYRDALQTAQSHRVHEALQHFPVDRVMRRFAQIWAATDPAHIKIMRKTGTLIELPLKMLFGAAGWARKFFFTREPDRRSSAEFSEKLDEDLISAVTGLHYQSVSARLSVSGSRGDPVTRRMQETITGIRARQGLQRTQHPRVDPAGEAAIDSFAVDAPAVVLAEQEKLRARDFKSLLQSILAHKDDIMAISGEMDKDLAELAGHFRNKMGSWAKISQTFWAVLNVLPATVAITYILSTGDPVGAAGIKIKLTGLFGAKDLYALFAIPATTGFKKADRKQLEAMLGPIMQAWLNRKLKIVQELFEQNITGEILPAAEKTIVKAGQLVDTIEKDLDACAREVAQP